MRQVLREACLEFGYEKPVSLILSIGSGRPGVLSLDLRAPNPGSYSNLLTRVVHDCERVARELSDQLFDVEAYVRLNVDRGVENIKMCDWHELGVIEAHTHAYLQTPTITSEIDASSQMLRERNAWITLEQLSALSLSPMARLFSHLIHRSDEYCGHRQVRLHPAFSSGF